MLVPSTAPKNAYDVLFRSKSDPISRLCGVHSSLDLMLLILQDPDQVNKNTLNDLYNTIFLLSNTIDQVEDDLVNQLTEIPVS